MEWRGEKRVRERKGRKHDLFCTPLQLQKAPLGLKRFASLSCLPRVLRSRTNKDLYKYINI